MSSTMMQSRPATSPITFMTSDSPGRSRRLSMMASGASSMRLGEPARTHHAAHVGRDDGDVAVVEAPPDVAHHHRRRIEVVGRDVEEALDLAGVQIDGQHAVGAGVGDHVGDELGRDRRARHRLAVLARIAEIGDHRRYAPRGGPLQRVDQDQEFHQVVVGGIGRRLDDEDIFAPDVLLHLDKDFHVREPPDKTLRERRLQIGGDGVSQRAIAIAGDQLHVS